MSPNFASCLFESLQLANPGDDFAELAGGGAKERLKFCDPGCEQQRVLFEYGNPFFGGGHGLMCTSD